MDTQGLDQTLPPNQEDASRERLLIAAQHLFCRYGVQGVGVAKVLEEAGVSRKTLYQRFRSKDDLVRAVSRTGGRGVARLVICGR